MFTAELFLRAVQKRLVPMYLARSRKRKQNSEVVPIVSGKLELTGETEIATFQVYNTIRAVQWLNIPAALN